MNALMKVAALVACLMLAAPKPALSAQSEIVLRGARGNTTYSTPAGYGSTGVYVRIFHFNPVSVGSDLTYTADDLNGDYITVNTDGVYAISYTGTSPFADKLGVSINGSPTQYLTQLGKDSTVCQQTFATSNIANCGGTLALSSGDVIRAHRDIGGTQACNCDVNEDEHLRVIRVD